jgi:LPPG:FO 2-phospho-L-lactate transferase
MITALCGGVGGAKLVHGLYHHQPDSLCVIVNTADDLEFCGLHISPDLDTVTYTLADLSRRDVGWGLEGDTFQALQMLSRYGVATWFKVGDQDMATHVYRTTQLQQGLTLTEIARAISRGLGVTARILPMCDQRVATRLHAHGEWLDFQDYFVRRHYQDTIDEVRYEGVEEARVTEPVLEAIAAAEALVVVNSNPVLSILPILAVPGVAEALSKAKVPRIAVSPIIGSRAISGPAADLMRLCGREASALGVARLYAGVVDGLVVDVQDAADQSAIEALGIRTLVTKIVMQTVADRTRLAGEILKFAGRLR